ncbi:hypothetical protein FQN49_004610 [Arthroderma sp. PD_2]|nr:hypothetical protein FQN49_004610 [Arthroderma sp. PD_2]
MAADYYKNHPYGQGSSRHYDGSPVGQPPYGEDNRHGPLPDYYPPGQAERAPYDEPRPRGSHRTGPRRSHSAGGGGRHRGRDRYDDYDSSRDEEPRRRRKHRHKRSSRHAHSVSPPSRSPSPLRTRKSIGNQALEALGFTGATEEVRRHDDRGHRRRHEYDDDPRDRRDHGRRRHEYDDFRQDSSRGKHRRRRSTSSDSRLRNHKDEPNKSLQNDITVALTAGVLEAYRARKEPGDWSGEKGKRVLAAVASAGGTEKLLDLGGSGKSSKKHILESTLAGLATGHLAGNSHSGKHRSHSESRGKAKTGATAALLAAAGKKAYDHYQSKSRDSGRLDYSSDDDRPSRSGRSNKKRSKSVSEYVTKGIASLGLNDDPDRDSGRDSGRGRDHRRHRTGYSSPSEDEYDYSDRPRRSRRHHGRH